MSLEEKASSYRQVHNGFLVRESNGEDTDKSEWVRLEGAQLLEKQIQDLGLRCAEFASKLEDAQQELKEWQKVAEKQEDRIFELEEMERRLEQAQLIMVDKIRLLEYEKVHGNLNQHNYWEVFKELLVVLEGDKTTDKKET